jgi:hypothetical protein
MAKTVVKTPFKDAIQKGAGGKGTKSPNPKSGY